MATLGNGIDIIFTLSPAISGCCDICPHAVREHHNCRNGGNGNVPINYSHLEDFGLGCFPEVLEALYDSILLFLSILLLWRIYIYEFTYTISFFRENGNIVYYICIYNFIYLFEVFHSHKIDSFQKSVFISSIFIALDG